MVTSYKLSLKMVCKPHLAAECCVIQRFKMLTNKNSELKFKVI